MKLSYFSYDFSACFCEAVNAGVCVGTFRWDSAVLVAVLRCCMAPLVFRAPAVSGRAALCARGLRPARESSAPRAVGSARRLEARPGPATAHGHRSLALPSLRRPPHQWSQVCCWLARRVGSKPISRPRPSPPPFLNHTQFRMQFPRYPLKPRIHNVGIATFSDSIETSPNRITCDFSEAVPATTHECRSHALTRGMGVSVSSRHPTAATATSSEPP